jgi:hypothetical protein
MAAVVDQDIDPRNSFRQGFQESSVFLIAYEYLDLLLFDLLAMRIDVYPEYFAPGPEIVFPHLQRASLRNTEFNNVRVGAAKTREVPLINVEVMLPFVDQSTGIFIEVFVKIVHG